MTTTHIATAAALVLAGSAALAAGPADGPDRGAIAAALVAEGYGITRFEQFDDAVSVTALKADRRLELALDSATGNVLGVAEYDGSGATGRKVYDDTTIRAALAAGGYAVSEYEREPGEIEVHATRDGRQWELEVDPRSGRITTIEGDS